MIGDMVDAALKNDFRRNIVFLICVGVALAVADGIWESCAATVAVLIAWMAGFGDGRG